MLSGSTIETHVTKVDFEDRRAQLTALDLIRPVRRLLGRLWETPGITVLRRRFYFANFRRGRPTNGFFGVYPSLEAARQSAPTGLIGYDHDSLAAMEISGFRGGAEPSFGPMAASEYPLLFWLRPLLSNGVRVFDFGGYLGNGFYLYRPYLDYPSGMTWTVCDVPAVAHAGQALADRKGETQLRFTTEIAEASNAEVLIAAGSLQYLEEGFLPKHLAAMPRRPRHVFVHRTPLHPQAGYVTMQTWHDGRSPVFCPYTVAHHGQLVAEMEALGYEVVDSWEKPRALDVPLHPECRLDAYAGLYFRFGGITA
jgi:putative methyltransferase (TIGR04325 family)